MKFVEPLYSLAKRGATKFPLIAFWVWRGIGFLFRWTISQQLAWAGRCLPLFSPVTYPSKFYYHFVRRRGDALQLQQRAAARSNHFIGSVKNRPLFLFVCAIGSATLAYSSGCTGFIPERIENDKKRGAIFE